jgi:hypothetical protein
MWGSLLIFFFGLLSLVQAKKDSSAALGFERTFPDAELEEFCSEKDLSSVKPGEYLGFTHPFYCSRYIECSIMKSNDEGSKIQYRESMCEKCSGDGDDAVTLCPNGYKKFKENAVSRNFPQITFGKGRNTRISVMALKLEKFRQ